MTLFKRNPRDEEDSVSLESDAHAWWAGRDHLERTFVPKKRTVPGSTGPASTTPSGPSSTTFAERFSTESLFNWASGPEPDDPTHGGNGLPLDPFRVLGLQPGASLSEVVSAHRTLAKRYHPDQLHGADEAVRTEAAQTMRTVNAAYQELRTRLVR